MKTVVFLILFLYYPKISGQENNGQFKKIYDLFQRQNYFAARDLYALTKEELSAPYRILTEAILDNAFNRCAISQEKIYSLKDWDNLPDTLVLKALELKTDNAIKLYQYKEAKETIANILTSFKLLLKKDDISSFENGLKIWSALENVPQQRVITEENIQIKMVKDLAGLNNLSLSANNEAVNFIFDTGANLCTASQTTAVRLKMKIFPETIEVRAVTGGVVLANLGVCDELSLGSIKIYNVVFLIMPDKDLYVEQIKYQINAILGYPVIAALNEVKLTRDGDFIVPKNASFFKGSSNMAMKALTPVIDINGNPYTFDTGANTTTLYHAFYIAHMDEINHKYRSKKISFAGTGGLMEFKGFLISHKFRISGKKVILKKIQLLKEQTKKKETVYGNIGQDLIQQFDAMTLNFKDMFIILE